MGRISGPVLLRKVVISMLLATTVGLIFYLQWKTGLIGRSAGAFYDWSLALRMSH